MFITVRNSRYTVYIDFDHLYFFEYENFKYLKLI